MGIIPPPAYKCQESQNKKGLQIKNPLYTSKSTSKRHETIQILHTGLCRHSALI